MEQDIVRCVYGQCGRWDFAGGKRLTLRARKPQLANVMSEALDRAWNDFAPKPKNKKLARQLMASAISEAVEAGSRDFDVLVRRATVVLIAAVKLDPNRLMAGRN